MPQRSRFQAPRVVQDFATVQRALRDVQEALDAATGSRAMLRVFTSDFSLVAGGFHRVSAQLGRTVNARLPAATGANLSEPVTLHLEGMQGAVRVAASPGQLVNGQPYATFDVDGVVTLWSNGVNAWTGVAQLPAESPGGAALDANYVLGAAHTSLPNAAVGTDTPEINFQFIPAGIATWLLNTASVAFSKLHDLTGLSVLGRGANSTGVMAAITATAARQTLRVNDAGTQLEWGHPVEGRDSGADQGDFFALDAVDGDGVDLALSVSSGVATLTPTVDVSDFAGGGLEDDGANNLRTSAVTGAISRAAGSTTSRFAGIRTNGVLQTARTHLNLLDTATILWTPADDAGNDEWGMRARHVFGNIRDNGSTETARGFINFVSVASDTQVSVTQDAGNDELEVRVSTLGSFYSENDVGSIQTKFISFDNGDSTAADVVDNTGGSGFVNVSYDYVGTSNDVVLNAITGAQGVVDISTLICGGRVGITAPTGAWSISGFTAKPEGFWFVFTASSTDFPGTIVNSTTANTGIRSPGFVDFSCNRQMSGLMMYGAFGGSSQWLFIPGALDPTELSGQLERVQSFTTGGTSNDVALNAGTTVLRVDTVGTDWTITGFSGGFDGRRLRIESASNSGVLGTLSHLTGSSAGNQLVMAGNVNLGPMTRCAAEFVYDGTDSVWRSVATNIPNAGRLLRVTRYTSGTAQTHTWLAGATTAIIDIVSSGGGGGSVANPAAAQCTLGGGGCSGTWVRALWTIDTATATYTVGAGAAGNASGNLSSFTDGTDTISCPGGSVGGVLASGTSLAYVLGGSAGALAATFTGSGFTVLNHNGGTGTLRPNAGEHGLRHSGTLGMSGFGAPSPFSGGGSGAGRQSSGVGAAGAAPGAGGGGAASFNAAGAFAGGASLAGIIVICEYS